MNRKTIILIIGIIGILLVLLFHNGINTEYSISDNKSEITNSILNSINVRKKVADKVEIRQEIIIDNYKYVAFTSNYYNKRFGLAIFLRDINKHYTDYKGWGYSAGTSYFIYNIEEINNNKYLILYGKNPDMKISYITVAIDELEGIHTEYKINLPKNDYFLVSNKLVAKTKRESIVSAKIKFFSEDNRDITEKMLSILQ